MSSLSILEQILLIHLYKKLLVLKLSEFEYQNCHIKRICTGRILSFGELKIILLLYIEKSLYTFDN